MTNTKPTWEDDFNKEFSRVGWIPENKERILTFIKKVEQDAYERGYEQAREDFLYDKKD